MKQAIKDFFFKEHPSSLARFLLAGLFLVIGFSYVFYSVGYEIGYDIAAEKAIKQCADLIYESYIKVPR